MSYITCYSLKWIFGIFLFALSLAYHRAKSFNPFLSKELIYKFIPFILDNDCHSTRRKVHSFSRSLLCFPQFLKVLNISKNKISATLVLWRADCFPFKWLVLHWVTMSIDSNSYCSAGDLLIFQSFHLKAMSFSASHL